MATNSLEDLLTRALSLRLGLKFVGERALAPEEIAQLELESQKYQKQRAIFGWLTFLVYLSPFLFGCLASIFFPGGTDPRYDAITDRVVGFVIVPLLSTSVLFWLLYYEGWRRGKQGLAWDLRAGAVQQFEGRAAEFKDRRFATQFFSPNSVSAEKTVHLVELLPHAQRVWKIDGVLVEPWKGLEIVSKLAAPVGIAIEELVASSFPKVLTANIPVEAVGERELTAIECQELERRLKSRSSSTQFFSGGINVMLMVGVPKLYVYFFHNQPLDFSPVELIFPGVWFLLSVRTIFSGLRENRQLCQDLAGRRVLQVRVPTSPYALPTSQRQGINLEILPNTRWVLTSEEQPTRWRAKPRQNPLRLWKRAS